MPEQNVSDRLTSRTHTLLRCDPAGVAELCAELEETVASLTNQLSDHRQIALVNEALVLAQDQQIEALRAEQARLRDFVNEVRLRLDASEPRPKGGQSVGSMTEDWHMTPTTRRNLRRLLQYAETPPEDDGKAARDNRPAFSQVDLDTATKPLHYQIEQLRAEQARLRADRSDYLRMATRYENDVEQLRAENERLKAGWQLIATAPKQRIVLLFAVTDRAPDGTVRNWKMATGDWHHAYESERVVWTWDGRELKAYDHQPTHWMPLPEAPST